MSVVRAVSSSQVTRETKFDNGYHVEHLRPAFDLFVDKFGTIPAFVYDDETAEK